MRQVKESSAILFASKLKLFLYFHLKKQRSCDRYCCGEMRLSINYLSIMKKHV